MRGCPKASPASRWPEDSFYDTNDAKTKAQADRASQIPRALPTVDHVDQPKAERRPKGPNRDYPLEDGGADHHVRKDREDARELFGVGHQRETGCIQSHNRGYRNENDDIGNPAPP